MYARILVPVDGSETSSKGLEEAIEIAKSQGSTLCLLHVVNEFIFDYSYGPGVYAANLIDSLRERGKAVLDESAALARKQGVQVEPLMLESIGGPAAEFIVSKASELKADLIVMGTHGRRGLRRLALGSDAEQVIRSAPVPVLLVRAPAVKSAKQPKAA
jgi:nucleotide-binding universal stress UspA family protein